MKRSSIIELLTAERALEAIEDILDACSSAGPRSMLFNVLCAEEIDLRWDAYLDVGKADGIDPLGLGQMCEDLWVYVFTTDDPVEKVADTIIRRREEIRAMVSESAHRDAYLAIRRGGAES